MASKYRASALAPGPRGRATFKLLPSFKRDAAGTLHRLFKEYGEVSQFHFGRRLNTLIVHPDQIRHVLVENASNYRKGIAGDAFKPLLGEGLLVAEGDLWRRHHELIQPAFRAKRLAAYVEAIVAETTALERRWRAQATHALALDLSAEMNQLAFGIIARALFGVELGKDKAPVAAAFDQANREGTHRLRSLFKLPLSWPTSHNRAYRAAIAIVRGYAARLLAERRAAPRDADDLLTLLGTPGAGIGEQEAVDEVVTLLFAGHETTSNALSWTFGLLAQHPAAVETARAEIASVLGTRLPTSEDLGRLPFVRAIFQEAMRLYPPIYAFQRRALAPDKLGEWEIPEGSGVTISAYVTHRHPAFWSNAEDFQPQRFVGSPAGQPNRLAYIPFGAGPRTCIGANLAMMEGVAILAVLLPRFDFALAGEQLPPAESMISLSPRGGMKMQITRRESSTQ